MYVCLWEDKNVFVSRLQLMITLTDYFWSIIKFKDLIWICFYKVTDQTECCLVNTVKIKHKQLLKRTTIWHLVSTAPPQAKGSNWTVSVTGCTETFPACTEHLRDVRQHHPPPPRLPRLSPALPVTKTQNVYKCLCLVFQALQHGFFDFETFDVDEYEHYEVQTAAVSEPPELCRAEHTLII